MTKGINTIDQAAKYITILHNSKAEATRANNIKNKTTYSYTFISTDTVLDFITHSKTPQQQHNLIKAMEGLRLLSAQLDKVQQVKNTLKSLQDDMESTKKVD